MDVSCIRGLSVERAETFEGVVREIVDASREQEFLTLLFCRGTTFDGPKSVEFSYLTVRDVDTDSASVWSLFVVHIAWPLPLRLSMPSRLKLSPISMHHCRCIASNTRQQTNRIVVFRTLRDEFHKPS